MFITERSVKALKSVYRRPSTYDVFLSRHGVISFNELLSGGLISLQNLSVSDSLGFPAAPVPGHSPVSITQAGMIEVESRKWFTSEYVVSHLIVPVVIGVVTGVLTTFLISRLL